MKGDLFKHVSVILAHSEGSVLTIVIIITATISTTKEKLQVILSIFSFS